MSLQIAHNFFQYINAKAAEYYISIHQSNILFHVINWMKVGFLNFISEREMFINLEFLSKLPLAIILDARSCKFNKSDKLTN